MNAFQKSARDRARSDLRKAVFVSALAGAARVVMNADEEERTIKQLIQKARELARAASEACYPSRKPRS